MTNLMQHTKMNAAVKSDDIAKGEVYMLTKEELPECPVATTVQLIGNKWELLMYEVFLAENHCICTNSMKMQ